VSIRTTQIKSGDLTWNVPEDDAKRVGDWLYAHFPAILDNEICLLKKDRGRRVAVAEGLVIKESTRPHGRSRLRFGFRPAASRRGFLVANQLIAGGVRMPRPVAWCVERRRGMRIREYLVTEQLAGCRVLTTILKAASDNAVLRKPVVEGMGELLAGFHRNGYSNRDLKDGNILVDEREYLKLWAVDMDGVRRMRYRVGGLRRDFRAILRSLGLYGWATEDDRRILLDAYNSNVPRRLMLRRLPPFNLAR
jgi:tRNA A-37 threonylcarbamoyl transferase component Bud32